MLWLALNPTFDCPILFVADSRAEALEWVTKITGIKLHRMLGSMEVITPEDQDDAIEAVELWWGAYCDYAEGNEFISDAEYDSVMDLVHRTFDAIYEV